MSEGEWEVVPKKEVKKKKTNEKTNEKTNNKPKVKFRLTEKKNLKKKRFVRAKYNNDSWQFKLLNGLYYDKYKKPYYNKFKIKDLCENFKKLTRRPNNEILNSMFDKIDLAISQKDWENDYYLGNIFNEEGNPLCDLNDEEKKKSQEYKQKYKKEQELNREKCKVYLENCKVKKNTTFADMLKKGLNKN